nr:hypothetical protein Itr_chr07CG08480 [Ipomoea trifida]
MVASCGYEQRQRQVSRWDFCFYRDSVVEYLDGHRYYPHATNQPLATMPLIHRDDLEHGAIEEVYDYSKKIGIQMSLWLFKALMSLGP